MSDFVLKSYLVIISLAKKNLLRVSGFSSHVLLRSTTECSFSSWYSTKKNSPCLETTNSAPIIVITHVTGYLTHMLSNVTVVLSWDIRS